MKGQVDGWTDGWTNGWMDEWTSEMEMCMDWFIVYSFRFHLSFLSVITDRFLLIV